MRFESCHQYFKKIARNSNNYVNIALSLSERHQFRKCWTSAAKNILAPDVKVIGRQNNISVSALPKALHTVLSNSFSV